MAALTAGLWDRFEVSIANGTRYDDPYADVRLAATYVRPDGSEVAFHGFHDGGSTWRLRFMPDQIGTWRYEAGFSDGAARSSGAVRPNGGPNRFLHCRDRRSRPYGGAARSGAGGASGTFECVASDVPGMVSSDEANPMWFGFKGGAHGLVRSFHVGDGFFASNMPAERRAAFLDWAQAQGYNTLSVASHYLNRRPREPHGGRGRGWRTPRLWPLSAEEYRRIEILLDDLAARRIMVFPFAGFFGRDADGPETPEERSLFIDYTLARLGPYWNVLLNVAGPEPNLDGYLPAEEVEGLGAEIARKDVFAHPLAVHNKTGDDPYRDSTWSSYGILQGPKTTDRAELSRGLLANHHASKPLYAQETLWSGNKFQKDYTDDDVRKNAYVINMSAAALNFGDMSGCPSGEAGEPGDSSAGFTGSLELTDRCQARHDIVRRVWDFFDTVPFYRMVPRRDFVDAGFCLAEPGSAYLVYLESPGTVNVAVEGGPYEVVWIDARDTSDRRPGGTTADGRGLRTPEGGDDWLLRLRL